MFGRVSEHLSMFGGVETVLERLGVFGRDLNQTFPTFPTFTTFPFFDFTRHSIAV